MHVYTEFLYSLFWKCSSWCGVRFALRDGVAGEPSSWRSEKLAWRSCPARFGMNLSVLDKVVGLRRDAHLSP